MEHLDIESGICRGIRGGDWRACFSGHKLRGSYSLNPCYGRGYYENSSN